MIPASTEPTTLARLPAGSRAVVTGLDGGRRLLSRMVTLGFVPGVEVRMIQNFGRGPIIVLVRQARIALGRGEALRVLVTPRRTAE